MLPPDFVINFTLKVGSVYKMTAPELIETSVPHFFVVVAINDDDSFLIMSTTQKENQLAHLKRRGFDLNTLAQIFNNSNNGLTAVSYFNCNQYHTISKEKLIEKMSLGILSHEGRFSELEYETIVDSIYLSEVNDIPKLLLIYE